jgi:hypothetical protein
MVKRPLHLESVQPERFSVSTTLDQIPYSESWLYVHHIPQLPGCTLRGLIRFTTAPYYGGVDPIG